jgi:Kef-type K+ transport system membrane component KefB/nucleotide-binding universal stress UspA family protein
MLSQTLGDIAAGIIGAMLVEAAQKAPQVLKGLPGPAVFLLLVQVGVLLLAARLGAELAKRSGLPPVVGELAAGIVVGPSFFGHYFPGAFAAVFPHDQAQFYLLDVVGTLGMVLLLLLTGLETDLRLLRNLGRAAFIASGMGMVIPFAFGLGLGLLMPIDYLNDPNQRVLFAFFVATAMSISAMPVIAKILMDLDLTKRNIGLVILSAGVVDDTAGWIILSVIAGVASHGEVRIAGMLQTIGLLAAFLALTGFVLYPVSRWLMSFVNRRFRTPDGDLVLILIMTVACAAATEHIGVHAVFGAFICGTMFRQVPHLKEETVHKLESFVFAVLAPIFFGIVGLKVDLWTLGGGGWLAIVLAVACIGKLVGCTLGSLWGGLRFWEGFSIAVAMNARGAMELVVATIGLQLGILNSQMFSIIVMVAIVTSFAAPLGLRLTMKKVRMTAEESRRILAEESRGAFDPLRIRVLLPSAGGPNARAAAMLAQGIARRSANAVEVLSVKAPVQWLDRLKILFGRPTYVTDDVKQVQQQVATVREMMRSVGLPPTVQQVESRSAAEAILGEARKDFDLLFIGASRRGNSLGGPVLEEIVKNAPCHLAVVKAGPSVEPYKNILVPFDGGVFARVAVEFAVRYAEATGAAVTIALLVERMPQAARLAVEEAGPAIAEERPAAEQELHQVSRIFLTSDLRPTVLRLAYDPTSSAIDEEASSGRYDLVVIGAENRAIRHRLFFGYNSERLLANENVAVALIVPNVAMLEE